MNGRDSRLALALALLLGGVGTLHFAVPRFFDALIPRALPMRVATLLRLPLQAPLVAWAWRVRDRA